MKDLKRKTPVEVVPEGVALHENEFVLRQHSPLHKAKKLGGDGSDVEGRHGPREYAAGEASWLEARLDPPEPVRARPFARRAQQIRRVVAMAAAFMVAGVLHMGAWTHLAGATLSEAEERSCGMRSVDIMTTPAITVRPRTPLKHLVHRMVEQEISGVPVEGAEGALLGIVTEADLLRLQLTPGVGEVLLRSARGEEATDTVAHGRPTPQEHDGP
jgi:hypothetical protein